MSLNFAEIIELQSKGLFVPDGRQLPKEAYPELIDINRAERIWIHRRFVVNARQNRLRLFILEALNPYRSHFELGDLVNFWE